MAIMYPETINLEETSSEAEIFVFNEKQFNKKNY